MRRYRDLELGNSDDDRDPIYVQESANIEPTANTFRNKTGLTVPLEQSMGRTLLDAEFAPNISKRCMIDIYLDSDPTIVFTAGSSSKTLIQVSWGVGGASMSTQFTIRAFGHYRMSVIGNWFRVSVLNQEIYVADPNAQLSASISEGETPEDEWGLFVGWIHLNYNDIVVPARTPQCAYLAVGNGFSTNNTGGATIPLVIGGVPVAGVNYYDILPKYARSYKILTQAMSQFYLDQWGFTINAGEYMPWLPINPSFFSTASTPPIIEAYHIGGAGTGPRAMVFVKF